MDQARKDINALFDALAHEKGVREAEIFLRFYKKKAEEDLSAFLHDVANCRPEIVEYCRELLAPKPGSTA